MTTDRTIRTAKALVWACALASILIGSVINDHTHGEFNG